MIETVLLAAVLGVAAGGAGTDVARRIIPNLLCIGLGLVAAAYAYFSFGLGGLGSAAIHALIALLVGMGLFAAGMIGGGDAKFYAAGALAVPLGSALAMLLWTVLSGFALLVVMVAGKQLLAKSGNSIAELRKMELPYGVAIAAGLAVALLKY